MNIKKVLGAVGLLAAGYGIGKIHGEIKVIKFVLDKAEEVFPGVKRAVAESVSDSLIDMIFKDENDGGKES